MDATILGEVIESSTTTCCVESAHLHGAPAFGSFIKLLQPDSNLYAVVFHTATQSLDPNRFTVAYYRSEEELRAEQPQIFELLKTRFEAVVIGYGQTGFLRTAIPPHPPRIHSFVSNCTDTEVRQITSDCSFLRLLMAVERVPKEELLAAAICAACRVHTSEHAFLVQAGKALLKLLGQDYEMLASILHRIHSGRRL